MKKWPLRWKLALYSALLAVIATLACAVTTWSVMRYAELSRFDSSLTMQAHEFFRDVENFEGGAASNRRVFKEKFVPLALRNRLVEVTDEKRTLLYLSPGLSRPFPNDGIKNFHFLKIDGRKIRLGEFSENGLSLRVGADTKEINEVAHNILVGMLAAIPTVMLVIVIGSRWVAGKALAPVEEIRQAAAQITAQRLGQRLPVPPTGDEIAGLIEVLNAAFERLQRSFEQSVRFSADASHHLKTPIAVVRAEVEEILADSECSLRTQATAEGLLNRIHHLTSVVDNLLLLARADPGRLELSSGEFDLSELLECVLDDARALAEPFALTVEADVPKHLPCADRVFVGMIAQNLLEKAVKYNPPGRRIRVAAQAIDGSVEIMVGNTGKGIPPEMADHLFERFCRARGDERVGGSGLGLSTSQELARAHGGEVALIRSDAAWTQLRVHLPAGRSAPTQ